MAKDGDHSPWTYSRHLRHSGSVHSADLSILGQRIRERRKALGWSQEELAARANVDRSYVGGVERGARNITFSMLCQLSVALGCKVSELVADLPRSGQ
jgi:transcriptional regulator with XRE-family HTH domain